MVAGQGGMSISGSGWRWFVDVLAHLPVPALALALPLAATLERLQSQSLADVLARALPSGHAGPRCRSAGRRCSAHAWPASLGPILGLYGVMVGSLFSGSFVVEVVTAWPGLGRSDGGRARRSRHLSGRGHRRGGRRLSRGGDVRNRRRARRHRPSCPGVPLMPTARGRAAPGADRGCRGGAVAGALRSGRHVPRLSSRAADAAAPLRRPGRVSADHREPARRAVLGRSDAEQWPCRGAARAPIRSSCSARTSRAATCCRACSPAPASPLASACCRSCWRRRWAGWWGAGPPRVAAGLTTR